MHANQIIVGMALMVLEILLLFKFGLIFFSDYGIYSMGSENRIG